MAAVAAITLPDLRNAPEARPELIVFPIAPAENSRFIGTSPEFAISPDGRQVAFVASSNRGSMLWVRSIDAVEIRPLGGTEGARNPFWSPDSQSVGYFAEDTLKIIRVNGGSPVDLSPVPGTAGAVAPSGTWSSGDDIVFGPMDGTRSFDVSTGRTQRLTGDQGWDFDPAWSPDGTHVAFNSNQPNPGTGPFGLFMRPADGGGNDVRVVEGEAGTGVVSPDWSLRDEIIYTSTTISGDWPLPGTARRLPS